ncbi:hypothetical protein METBIDRAFT_32525 [Metschnikowia bicuspidata var. bicuspidata NRRL YB-4993]|uniref:PCI domain-containing protein n=1 Tax=Metschnikowia bicuspidata var. bicuspidata NRRL YB-4993 TaxID=869754 RepID=A0A1A0H958_9ASCO|nr:hypothetical protein METBIDRAFT_32525 [Metschnikowia bicuspidata var. bicuspidata NRRL YB-4993]OBA20535.1 hypothetical protein METBIDRAFT_32525 [Metschnikowia bicuspidata var. bicuspidata NRRL YB-4993]
MECVEDFLQRLQNCTCLDLRQQPLKLLELLRLHPQMNPFVVKINNLGHLSEGQILLLIERRHWFNGAWLSFDQLIVSFLRLCNQVNPWSLLESFDLYTTYLNDITVAFMNKKHGYLITYLLEDVLKQVLYMSKLLDYHMLHREMCRKPRLNFMASILLKIFNNIRSQIGADDYIDAVKKSIMVLIGVKLCQTYFQLSNPLLCQNVFSNMGNANLDFSSYHPNQQLQYRFYLAKFYIAKYEFVDAFEHLDWCLARVPYNYSVDSMNVSTILRQFLLVSILLGKRPKFGSFSRRYFSAPLKCPKYFSIYAELENAIRLGNFYRLHNLINDAEISSFLKRQKFASFFSSKAYLITLRNLVKTIWLSQGKQVRLGYDATKQGLLLSLNGLELSSVSTMNSSPKQHILSTNLDDHSIENCLVTLIDQNLLRGKVFPRLRVVSLAKNEVFPDISANYFLKFGNGSGDTLRPADQWIKRGS